MVGYIVLGVFVVVMIALIVIAVVRKSPDDVSL
jgi:beta-lactam-binding protein with PASTA domain